MRKLDSKWLKDQIMIKIMSVPGEDRSVFVSLNGYNQWIEREKWVKVPTAFIEVLEHSVHLEPRYDKEAGKMNGFDTVRKYLYMTLPVDAASEGA